MRYIIILILANFVHAQCINKWTGGNFEETCVYDSGVNTITSCGLDDDNYNVECYTTDNNGNTYSCNSVGIFGTNNHKGKKGQCCYDGDDCKKSCTNHICS